MSFVFPGKMIKNKEGDVVDVHPLHQHSLDCAMGFKALLQDPVSRKNLARLGGLPDLTTIQVERACVLAFWHDVGKAATGFAVRSRPDADKPAETGHVEEAFALFGGDLGLFFERIYDLTRISDWFSGSEEAACDFLLAALSHHGRPVHIPAGSAERAEYLKAWTPWKDVDPKDELMRMGLLVRMSFPDAFDDADPANRLPSSPRFQAGFAGFVMLADWLASNADMFTYASAEQPRSDWAYERATSMTTRIGWGLDAMKPIIDKPIDFTDVFGFTPNAMQASVAALGLPASGSIINIESDTGSGKTEAGLMRALKLISAGLSSGVYFALPSRTSAVQIHRRIATALTKLLGDKAPPVLLAVPGYLRVGNVEGRRLPDFRVRWEDGLPGPERWSSENPKRFLAAPIVIGTIDQALMSVIRTNHAHMRASMLARMAIIIDEVHAFDARLDFLTGEMIDRHMAHGGHAILMSATFSSTSRRRYLKEQPIGLGKAMKLAYPAITMLAGDGKRTDVDPAILQPLAKARRRRINIDRAGILRHPDKIAEIAADAAKAGAKVLVIRNTVSSAVETQTCLEHILDPDKIFQVGGQVTSPHHSRYASVDRKVLDEAVELAFGKNSPREGRVLIATQTMEQSIDIDCDLLITDLCPMEALIQRLGRLHRHVRKDRPAGFKKPNAIVIVPETRHVGLFVDKPHHGFGQAYADLRIIEATWRELESRKSVVLPMENRMLVERTTHPDALNRIAAEIGLDNHAEDIAANVAVAKMDAKAALLDIDHSFGDIAMNRTMASEDVQVRLGGLDTTIEFPEPIMGPFGHKIYRLTIPGWMARPDPDNLLEAPRVLGALDAAFEFTWGFKEQRHLNVKPVFRYSRLGLEITSQVERS